MPVWGLKQPRLPPVIAAATLRCLRGYLISGSEEQAAEKLWEGFWGTAGVCGVVAWSGVQCGVGWDGVVHYGVVVE
jgi:hypothetical protein